MSSKLTSFNYEPGDKWSCGLFEFTADTEFGKLEWDEVVPGPRHGEHHASVTAKLAGYELNLEHFAELDFEPPGKEGKWADAFRSSYGDVEDTLDSWLEDSREALIEFLEEKKDEEQQSS